MSFDWKRSALLSAGRAVAAVLLFAGTAFAAGGADGFVGDWKTPDGAVIRLSRCDASLCLAIVKLGPTAKGTIDALNPDAALRGRALCGMRIGDGFKPEGDVEASGGHIYDPESGKTYSAKLAWKGDTLRLRGFVGLSMFGRTETWKRIPAVESCRAAG